MHCLTVGNNVWNVDIKEWWQVGTYAGLMPCNGEGATMHHFWKFCRVTNDKMPRNATEMQIEHDETFRFCGTCTPLVQLAFGRTADAEIAAFLEVSTLGDCRLLARMLDTGTPIDARDDSGWSALLWAIHCDNPDAVRLLLKRGCSCRAAKFSTYVKHPSALALCRSASVMRLLLQLGRTVPERDFANVGYRFVPLDTRILHVAVGANAKILNERSDWATADAVKPVSSHKKQLSQTRWRLFRPLFCDVALALQPLDLPALLTCAILKRMYLPGSACVEFHLLWNVAATVKHFSA